MQRFIRPDTLLCGIAFAVCVAAPLQVYADDKAVEKPKPSSCQDRLNDTVSLTNVLSEDRNRKEVSIAKSQVLIVQLRQRNEFLEKQIADMQKAIAPKGEAPPAEQKKPD